MTHGNPAVSPTNCSYVHPLLEASAHISYHRAHRQYYDYWSLRKDVVTCFVPLLDLGNTATPKSFEHGIVLRDIASIQDDVTFSS